MKKFSPFLLASTCSIMLFSSSLIAQKNNISLSAGPSAFRFTPNQIQKSDISPPMGYMISLDLARNIRPRWKAKLGLRYALWQVPDLEGPFLWPSEHNGNGGYQFDPSLEHYFKEGHTGRGAIQLLSGVGWESNAEGFRWFVNAEFGLTRFLKNTEHLHTRFSPTAGLSFGSGWMVKPNLCLFIMPSGRLIFRGSSKQYADKFNLFSMQVEMGCRYSF